MRRFSLIRLLGYGYKDHRFRIIQNNFIYDNQAKLLCGRNYFLWSIAFWIGEEKNHYWITTKGLSPLLFNYGITSFHIIDESFFKFLLLKYKFDDVYERLYCFDLKRA